MRIAVFDYDTVASNPYGKGVLRLLEALCDRHEFTVYSTRFENPRPDRIGWRRVPALRRPLLGLFITFHVGAACVYAFDRFVRRQRYDIVQTLETASFGADVAGVQFCHRAYLRTQWRTSRPNGARGLARWLYEWCAAALEPFIFRRARLLVVPSRGLADELNAEFPFTEKKTVVVSNAVDLAIALPDNRFDRDAFRRRYGLDIDGLVLVFTALGHFERKGLPLVFDALRLTSDLRLQVVVVGGTRDLVAHWEDRARAYELGERVKFVGRHDDPRSFLWAADGFVFPSAYETFSYVSFEAAAAGLPLIVSELYGVEEFLVDGQNGLLVERSAASIANAMRRLAELGPEGRRAMGERARGAVSRFDVASYTAGWCAAYERVFDMPVADKR